MNSSIKLTTTMATDVFRSTSGTQPSPGSGRQVQGSGASSPLSSADSTGSHRNKHLLKSYHDFAMQLFSSGQAYGETDALFVAAARSGDFERVENLLHRRSHEVINIDARDRDTGDTALMWAVRNGHMKIIRLLLKHGADVTLRNGCNQTALEIGTDRDVRRILLESVTRAGVSPRLLLQAAWQGDVGVVKRLLGESTVLDINCQNADGCTPLLLVTRDVELFESIVGSAVESYDPLAVIDELLRHRADPVASDREGHSPLHHAASAKSPLGEEIALRLAQIPLTAGARDARSLAPIHAASQSGSVDVVVALLDRGVDVNLRGYAGATPLHVSASAGQIQVANTLLHRGADVTLVDDGGNTAVDVAKTKRLKTVLKEAWTEVTQSRRESVLSPVKPPSRMDSSEGSSPRQAQTQGLSLTSSPSESFGNTMLQKLTDAHEAALAHVQTLKDVDSGRFTPGLTSRKLGLLRGQSRNSPIPSPNRTPAPSKTPRVLDPLTPPKKPDGSVASKRPRCSMTSAGRANSSGVGVKSKGHEKLGKTKSDPTPQTTTTETVPIPLTVVGLDLDESLQDVRFQRLVSNVRPLDRHLSDPGGSVARRYRGRSSRQRPSDPGTSDGAVVRGDGGLHGDRGSHANLAHIQPLRTSHLLNLEQMHVRLYIPSPNLEASCLYPNAKTILTSSPSAASDYRQRQDTIFEFEDEEDKEEEVDDRIVDGEKNDKTEVENLRLDLGEVDTGQPLLHHRVMFNIEASRINPLKDSSDSGQGSSRSTLSHASSSGSIITSSPSPQLELDRKDAAKNRLGIKMTPSATKLPEERGVLFHRAQTRLPSLGRTSPTANQQQSKKPRQKTSEDCLSVLSVSSINAHMMDVGHLHDKGDGGAALPSECDLNSTITQSQVGMIYTPGKRKISLEDHSLLLNTQRESPSTVDQARVMNSHAGVSRQTNDTCPSMGNLNMVTTAKAETSSPRNKLSKSCLKQKLSNKVEPVCNSSAGSLSNQRLIVGRNHCAKSNGDAGTNSTSRVKGTVNAVGRHTGKNTTLVMLSKPEVRTLEVLPGSKVTKKVGKMLEKGPVAIANNASSNARDEGSEGRERAGIEAASGNAEEPPDAGLKMATNSAEDKTSSIPAKTAVQSVTESQTSLHPHNAAKSKRALPCASGKVTKVVTVGGQFPKTSSKSIEKQGNFKPGSRKGDWMASKESCEKPSGSSAIHLSKANRTAANKAGVKAKKIQSISASGKKETSKFDEGKKDRSWRILCDDDSSESDFESGAPRFAELVLQSETVTTAKGHHDHGKTDAAITPGNLPNATGGDNQGNALDVSDAEEILEEVIFSGGEDYDDLNQEEGRRRGEQPSRQSATESMNAKVTSCVKDVKGSSKNASSRPPTVPEAILKEGLDISSLKTNKQRDIKVSTARQSVPHAGKKSNGKVENRGKVTGQGVPPKKMAKPDIGKRKDRLVPRPVHLERNTEEVSEHCPANSNVKGDTMAGGNQKDPESTVMNSGGTQNTDTPDDHNENEVTRGTREKGEKEVAPTAGEWDETNERGCGMLTDSSKIQEKTIATKEVIGEGWEVDQTKLQGQDHVDPAVKVTTSEHGHQTDPDVKVTTSEQGHQVWYPSNPSKEQPGSLTVQKTRHRSPTLSPCHPNVLKVIQNDGNLHDPMAAKQSPVIMDLLEIFNSARTSSSPKSKTIEVLGKVKNRAASVKGPVRKSVKPGARKTSSASQSTAGRGGKGRKESVSSGGKTKGRVGSGGSKCSDRTKTTVKVRKAGGKGKGKKTMEEVNLNLVQDSESSKTAFITGQGWHIKTSCNENDDVIIRDGMPGDSSDGESGVNPALAEVQLSPHNSLKLDELASIKGMSIEEKKNIVNILSPLEMHTPIFIPDTMGTIKEFADSLKSTSSSEMSASQQPNAENHSNPPTNGKSQCLDSAEQSAKKVPEVRIRKSSLQSPDATGDGDPAGRIHNALGVTGELSECETNPELLKVFKLKDHFETFSPQESCSNSITSDDEELVKEHLGALLSSKQESSGDANGNCTNGKEGDPSQELPEGEKKGPKGVLRKKPPLPKPLQSHQIRSSKKHSPRSYMEPDILSPSRKEEIKSDDKSNTDSQAKESCGHQMDSNAQVSAVKSSLPTSPPASEPRGHSLTDVPTDVSHSEEPTTDEIIREEIGIGDYPDDVEGQDHLTKHVRTLTEKTLQEFSSTIAGSQDGTTTSIIHTRPPSTATTNTRRSLSPRTGSGTDSNGRDFDDRESLTQSLALSEASSDVSKDLMDTGENMVASHGASTSSAFSGAERSLSANTTLSESEGTEQLHWKKGNLLGKGAFGMVYCGLTNTGQLLAVKQVELSERDKDKAKQQYQKLQEEVQLLKTLSHRNIVGFLGVSLEDNTVNIFMQFIPGGSIASLLARFGALDEPVFCRYTKQILEGTQYLHENSVIHRDIKGANIMLMSNGVIKLIDFGCAKRLCIQLGQSQNVLRSMRGTPYWMAPEVVMETGHGKKSDIWSIGCTVFEMATRKPPWADMPPMAAIFAIGSGDPVPQMPEKFSEDARSFVNTCLTRDQDQRPTASELLKHPFIRRRKDRGRDRFQTRLSSSTLEEGPIVFREQPISRDSSDSRGRKHHYAPDEFR